MGEMIVEPHGLDTRRPRSGVGGGVNRRVVPPTSGTPKQLV
ncbi:MAG: hypothetical protein ABL971_16885 [Vicinamibacterales bacterium]